MSNDAARDCVHCGEPMPPRAVLCGSCSKYQMSRWGARLTAHPAWRLVSLLVIGFFVSFGGFVYQESSMHYMERAERTRDLVMSGIALQTMSEQFQRPCPITPGEDELSCRHWFADNLKEMSRLAYVFKASSKYILREPSRYPDVIRAIDFIDDFYNPGALDTSRLLVFPLQPELSRTSALLAMPRDQAKDIWCSVEVRQRMRALAASINTYRYCFRGVRAVAEAEARLSFFESHFGGGVRPSESLARRLKNCSEGDLVTRINRIAELIASDSANYTAPWHYDAECGESARHTIDGGLIPTSTEQLVVVVTDDWDATTGTARRLERRGDGAWAPFGDSAQINVGRNGLAWGRGLHPFPGEAVGDHEKTRAPPPKREGDGRAPAGLFRLGRTYFDPSAPPFDAAVLERLRAKPVTADMFCEDRAPTQPTPGGGWPKRGRCDARGSPRYNCPVRLDKGAQKRCGLEGRCPETLLRKDHLYHAFVWVEHNAGGSPGAGSCIFLHIERDAGKATAGCTSMARDRLEGLLEWLKPDRQPLLLQLPRVEYEARIVGWDLPPLELLTAAP